MRQIEPNLKFKITNLQFTMAFSQPNPASDYVVASYRITAGHSASLVLSDATGRQLEVISIKPETNQKVVSFARFTGGHYLVTLVIDGKNVETGVISVVK
jgi:predicted aspartyl protease